MKAYTTFKKKEIEVTNPYNNEQKEYVIVEYKEQYTPEVWAFNNGDPGHPSDIDIEISSWSLLDEDAPTWLTDDLVEVTFYNEKLSK